MATQLATTLPARLGLPLIAGDWSNAHYSRGYADGKNAGKKDCKER